MSASAAQLTLTNGSAAALAVACTARAISSLPVPVAVDQHGGAALRGLRHLVQVGAASKDASR